MDNTSLNQVEQDMDFFRKTKRILQKQEEQPKNEKKHVKAIYIAIACFVMFGLVAVSKHITSGTGTFTEQPIATIKQTQPETTNIAKPSEENLQKQNNISQVQTPEQFMKSIDTSKLTNEEKKNLEGTIKGLNDIGKQIQQIQKDSERFQQTKK